MSIFPLESLCRHQSQAQDPSSRCLLDRFEGAQLAENKVSQAFRLRYRGRNTLTEEDVQPVHDKVRSALAKEFQAELRS